MGIQPASDELSHQMQKLFKELLATEKISEGSPMVRVLDDFPGGTETEEGLGDLMEKFLHNCQTGGGRLPKPLKVQYCPRGRVGDLRRNTSQRRRI